MKLEEIISILKRFPILEVDKDFPEEGKYVQILGEPAGFKDIQISKIVMDEIIKELEEVKTRLKNFEFIERETD